VSKYDDHLPLYRQAEIFARDGVSLETSTLSGWVGATAAAVPHRAIGLCHQIAAGSQIDDLTSDFDRSRTAGIPNTFAID
jgi:transposase